MNTTQTKTFLSKANIKVWIRPLTADDAPHLVNIFEHMSPESRYRRFQTPVENPSPSRVWQTAKQIAAIPEPTQFGWIAFANMPDNGTVPIGVARYVQAAPGTVEVAISIRDDMQNQGIGSRLLAFLIEAAQSHGIHTMTASIQNANMPMWRLLEKTGYPLKRKIEGSSSEIWLDIRNSKQT